MPNVQVTPVLTTTGMGSREGSFNGPIEETENARFEQMGPYRTDNIAASATNTVMTLGAVDAVAPVSFPAGRAGTIVGIAARSNADLSAGTATFRPSINGTVAGVAATESAILSDTVQTKVGTFTTPVAFVAGDLLGIMLTTDAGYLPVTADNSAYLLIRWAA